MSEEIWTLLSLVDPRSSVGGFWLSVFLALFAFQRSRLSGLSPQARGRWVARLRHDAYGRRYREMLASVLDWIDAKLSPGFDADAQASKTEMARAWSARLLNFCLLLAVVYPVAGTVLEWTITGDASRAGGLVVIAEEDALWKRWLASLALLGMLWSGWRFGVASSSLVKGRHAVLACVLALAFIAVGNEVEAGPLAMLCVIALTAVFATSFGAAAIVVALGSAYVRVEFFFVAAALVCFGFLARLRDRLARRTDRPTLCMAAYAAIMFAVVLLGLRMAGGANDDFAAMALFIGVLPPLNALADFASTGLTRWWLRQGLRDNLVGHALRDAIAALAILLALGFALIMTIRFVTPRNGQPIVDLAELFVDLRGPAAADYYWLYFCFFSTLLPTVLHFGVACFGLFTLLSKRLGRPIADLLQAGATDSVKAKDGVLALSACIAAAAVAPFLALHLLFLHAGRPILDGLLWVFEGFARAIGAV